MESAPLHAVSRRLGSAGNWYRGLRKTTRQVGMRAYHRATALNYRGRLLAPERLTTAGPYRSYELVTSHAFDPLLAALAATVGPDDTVYDIGAYAGGYALPLAADTPRRTVVAVEPDTASRRRLRANRDRTAPDGTVLVRPVGVGAADEHRPFYRSSFPKLSSFDRADATRWGAHVTGVETARIRTLDTLTERLPAPDHIKIDVEGLAPAVLAGAAETVARHRPTLFVEPHDRPGADRTGAIRAWCTEHGYTATDRNGALVCRP
ncbi:MAG: methyltransferase, FkbM family [halophilic archaeon J07HX64]|jgi:methyltransferase, FkbM family|nr:MAG: methyltransferase, FkbM family [halophilic archaeon J07HX64]